MPTGTQTLVVRFTMLPHGAGLEPPAYQSADAAGFDIRAAVGDAEPMALAPGERALVPAGFSMELPAGFEAQIRPRSGLALKHGLTVLNAPGTIDADYRGEIMVLLVNHGTETFEVSRGTRIAQIVVQPVTRAEFVAVAELAPSTRGTGGFGSTGSE